MAVAIVVLLCSVVMADEWRKGTEKIEMSQCVVVETMDYSGNGQIFWECPNGEVRFRVALMRKEEIIDIWVFARGKGAKIAKTLKRGDRLYFNCKFGRRETEPGNRELVLLARHMNVYSNVK